MTRNVAEVIGWSSFDWFETPAGWCMYGDPGPTADDLLAWLREQGMLVNYRQGLEAAILAVGDVNYPIDFHPLAQFPTLLAALERAVLAVAGE